MNEQSSTELRNFKNTVALKFQLYNSLFTSLPFDSIEKTGILLSLFMNFCEEGYARNLSPSEIIEDFFSKQTEFANRQEQLDLLFRFIQYSERQVVLFDAIEDAAFTEVHDMKGKGTVKQLEMQVMQGNKESELRKKLEDFSVELVLTAHPTQFYPGPVLGIINDLSKAVAANNAEKINIYLQQLGKTPFLKKEKPTPFDEATSLLWYLENVFFAAAGKILSSLKRKFPNAVHDQNPVIKMGFWPGGDRDGNPFVNAETSLKVAEALRGGIIKCYYQEIRKLRRRLTFKGVEPLVIELEKQLYNNLFVPGGRTNLSSREIINTLLEISEILNSRHGGLFVHLVENLINKVHIFGLYFASLDIRQDSSIHKKVFAELASKAEYIPADYEELTDDEKTNVLTAFHGVLPRPVSDTAVVQDTFDSIRVIKDIQQLNGVEGCNRYIISHCTGAVHVLQVYQLFLLGGWKPEEMNVDIVPLIETIDDLKNGKTILVNLYNNPVYRQHLARRGDSQTVMLGFSDGSKDGGYMMGNWSIYKAKEEITAISRENGIKVIFFDGRGGPPARGGGKTHKFYAGMGKNISSKEIQLTIQGQTVSSNFGTVDSAQFNLEQLIHAGISSDLFAENKNTFNPEQEALMEAMAEESYKSYLALKNAPEFMNYLIEVSPLQYFSATNIGSRPTSRGTGKITMEDLRAIPFVGSWSQLKQNVTGFYGMGTALKKMEADGKMDELKQLYQDSMFFKTLVDNCEMAMKKCFFPLTAYLANDAQFGIFWKQIFDEYEISVEYLKRLTGHSELMQGYEAAQLSVSMREKIVLPLLTIQQYAMSNLRNMQHESNGKAGREPFEKLVMRCSFGIINAGRNSA